MKTQQWDFAIHDLTTAISVQTGGVVLLSNIQQFWGEGPSDDGEGGENRGNTP